MDFTDILDSDQPTAKRLKIAISNEEADKVKIENPLSSLEFGNVGIQSGDSIEKINDVFYQQLFQKDEDLAPEPKLLPGAYSQREEALITQESAGEIKFCYVENDGTPQNMMYLTGLKNIFSKQLPNMPKEYICRLVYDRRHRSVALVKRSGTVIGGITYRSFPLQGLGEIAFCAVTSTEQVKGFGTRLMNHTKEFARTKDHLSYFLTYADNNAVGYFAKQGFTKELSMERERWHGYIKDYDGGTLMEFAIHPKICYTQFPDLIRTQRHALDLKIRAICKAHVVRCGLKYFKQHPSSADPADPPEAAGCVSNEVTGTGSSEAAGAGASPDSSNRMTGTVISNISERPPLPIDSIPGVLEAFWTPDQGQLSRCFFVFKEGAVDSSPEALQRLLLLALQELQKNEDAWPFLLPVTAEEVPDYHTVIKDPIDLSLMESRLKQQNFYLTLDIFIADFKRMMNNCRLYNSSESIFYKLANKLEATFNTFLAAHVINLSADHSSVATPL
ncbi:hypothetical protein CEUSTIGMA_g8419.t1 [Chlamydomonas eustigma]|uniref:histone acetyltransferase n=1 Tax=Chlamydomonas eustigma TaxID=1157962 RepID=A0A250XD24_9CHLO|nr:hypothetical protein CEUSTIGMA_g8419.t1 [Chlamydomonas eustigma]|eukprot:GAX80984.1 hypothetical protein CEUSTIGMA_g8419.t1 [Chlamydomonas eustigma]